MGLLDELLGGLAQGGLDQTLGQQSPRGRGGLGQQPMSPQGGGMNSVLMALLPLVLSMLASRQGGGGLGGSMGNTGGLGGLGGLLEQFQRMGYADQANSWVGTGSNLPISPEIIAQVFGRDGLSQIASQAGLTESEASVGLSAILPDVVDRLTPKGNVPDLDALAASVDDLARRFRG
jgi:uncharacterized protein YidB (DUF937 family)